VNNYVYLYSDANFIGRYVGRGTGRRAIAHLKATHNLELAQFLKDSISGNDQVHVEILTGNLSTHAANAIERFWIAVFGRQDKQTGSLFNHTDGGQGWDKGRTRGKPSASHREKLSIAQKGKPKKNPAKTSWSKDLILGPRDCATKHKIKMAWADLLKDELTCPHCGKIGRGTVMKRWHFEQCRVKEQK
jgi:hypothetical protein